MAKRKITDSERRKKIIENITAGLTGNPLPHVIGNVTDEELKDIKFNDDAVVIPVITVKDTLNLGIEDDSDVVSIINMSPNEHGLIVKNTTGPKSNHSTSIIGIDSVKGINIRYLKHEYENDCRFSDEIKPRVKLLLKVVGDRMIWLKRMAPALLKKYEQVVDETTWDEIFGENAIKDIIQMPKKVFIASVKTFLKNELRELNGCEFMEAETLKDIFTNDDTYNEAIEALQKVKNPIIDDNLNYRLGVRQKSVFAAWMSILTNRPNKIKPVSNIRMAAALNATIKGLNLYQDGGTLDDINASAAKKYYSLLSKLIP